MYDIGSCNSFGMHILYIYFFSSPDILTEKVIFKKNIYIRADKYDINGKLKNEAVSLPVLNSAVPNFCF